MYVNPSLAKINSYIDVDIPSNKAYFEKYGYKELRGVYSRDLKDQGALGSTDTPIRDLHSAEAALLNDYKQTQVNK